MLDTRKYANVWIVKKGKYLKLVRVKSEGNTEFLLESVQPASSLDEAWEKTLEKWQFIKHAHKKFGQLNRTNGAETCGLCNLYLKYGPHEYNCNGCPIKKVTGVNYCGSTPYDEYMRHSTFENAQAEYEFLINLKRKELS